MSVGKGNIPLGLGMALVQNPEAMQYFTSLSEAEQQSVINNTHEIHSKKDMQLFVKNHFSL